MDFTVREGTFPFTPEFRKSEFFKRALISIKTVTFQIFDF